MDVRQFSSDKILKHLDRVNEWLSGDNPSPVTVELDMTNICNHRCPECASNYFRISDTCALSKPLAFRIVSELHEAKIRGLIFTGGGEPLCNLNTIDTVKLAKELGLDIGFITNGSLLNEVNAETLLKCCRWIRISLDASNEDMFKKTHGLDNKEYKKIINSIIMFSEIKKRLKPRSCIRNG